MNKIILSASLSVVVIAFLFASAVQVSAAEYPNIITGNDMSLGTSNQNVVVLQGLLTEMGYLNVPAGVPFGYYGSLTKNALALYQSRINVTPSVGYYGPTTKSAMYNDFSSHGWLGVLGWNN